MTFATDLAAQRPFLTKFINRMARGDYALAEDIASDAIMLAWQHRDSFTGSGLRTWLTTIARRRLFAHCRAQNQKRYGGSTDDLLPADLPWMPAPQEAPLHLADTMAALDRLSPEMRDAVIQVALGDSSDEAAVCLGVAEGTVKSRVCRGRARLKDILK